MTTNQPDVGNALGTSTFLDMEKDDTINIFLEKESATADIDVVTSNVLAKTDLLEGYKQFILLSSNLYRHIITNIRSITTSLSSSVDVQGNWISGVKEESRCSQGYWIGIVHVGIVIL